MSTLLNDKPFACLIVNGNKGMAEPSDSEEPIIASNNQITFLENYFKFLNFSYIGSSHWCCLIFKVGLTVKTVIEEPARKTCYTTSDHKRKDYKYL